MSPAPRHAALAATVGAAVFLAGALLFIVQPMTARALLPAFGGSSSVWATALVFYQLCLLAGYALAHLGFRLLPAARQRLLQVALVGTPLVLLVAWLGVSPPTAALGMPPLPATGPASAGIPALEVGLRLLASVGPFAVALATAGPVLQRWFAASSHPRASDPYVFYAAGNAGSLLGLLAYPFLVEPLAGLRLQALGWSAGYLAFAALVALAAVGVLGGASSAGAAAERTGTRSLPAGTLLFRWVLFAAIPAALAIAVTTAITLDLSASPLLWNGPLVLYLLSWVVAFAPGAAERAARWAGVAAPLATVLLALVLLGAIARPLWLVLALHLLALFVLATALHARLALERPPPQGLTGFYLAIATGGALGGLAAAILAPAVLDGLLELPLAAAAAAALHLRADRGRPGLRLLATAGACGLVVLALETGPQPGALLTVLLVAPIVLLAERRLWFGLAGAAVLLLGQLLLPPARLTERSFYGLYRVVDDAEGRRALISGTTVQGIARVDPGSACRPLGYYHAGGPIGELVAALQAERPALRVAVVGLGIGGMTALGRPEDSFTFVEIDPLVVSIARDTRLFRYLEACPARSSIIVGDGRLVLEAEPPGSYDLVALDAFSSNAVPVHLLTREALAGYAGRLGPGGLIAANVSNRYLRLEPVLAAASRDLGLTALARSDPTDPQRAGDADGSHWVVMGRGDALAPLRTDPRWRPATPVPGRAAWSDDRAELVSAIDWAR